MNPQSPAASKFAGAGVVAAVVCGLATPAAALDDRRLFALAVVVELQDAGKLASFGSLNLFMRRLRLAGHVCNTSPYAYGVNISCGTNTQSPLVLIHLDFAPTRGPDFLSVGGVRSRGINGGGLPQAEWFSFLSDYSASTAKFVKF